MGLDSAVPVLRSLSEGQDQRSHPSFQAKPQPKLIKRLLSDLVSHPSSRLEGCEVLHRVGPALICSACRPRLPTPVGKKGFPFEPVDCVLVCLCFVCKYQNSASAAMSSLGGQSAFVTGGGSGIGRAICLDLARLGCRLTVGVLTLRGSCSVTVHGRCIGPVLASRDRFATGG